MPAFHWMTSTQPFTSRSHSPSPSQVAPRLHLRLLRLAQVEQVQAQAQDQAQDQAQEQAQEQAQAQDQAQDQVYFQIHP